MSSFPHGRMGWADRRKGQKEQDWTGKEQEQTCILQHFKNKRKGENFERHGMNTLSSLCGNMRAPYGFWCVPRQEHLCGLLHACNSYRQQALSLCLLYHLSLYLPASLSLSPFIIFLPAHGGTDSRHLHSVVPSHGCLVWRAAGMRVCSLIFFSYNKNSFHYLLLHIFETFFYTTRQEDRRKTFSLCILHTLSTAFGILLRKTRRQVCVCVVCFAFLHHEKGHSPSQEEEKVVRRLAWRGQEGQKTGCFPSALALCLYGSLPFLYPSSLHSSTVTVDLLCLMPTLPCPTWDLYYCLPFPCPCPSFCAFCSWPPFIFVFGTALLCGICLVALLFHFVLDRDWTTYGARRVATSILSRHSSLQLECMQLAENMTFHTPPPPPLHTRL